MLCAQRGGRRMANGSRASSARQNENLPDRKPNEQRATQRKRDRREVERAVRDGVELGRMENE